MKNDTLIIRTVKDLSAYVYNCCYVGNADEADRLSEKVMALDGHPQLGVCWSSYIRSPEMIRFLYIAGADEGKRTRGQ